jgi:hypothetical protein
VSALWADCLRRWEHTHTHTHTHTHARARASVLYFRIRFATYFKVVSLLAFITGSIDCRVRGVGPCTRHANRCALGGCGAFLLLQVPMRSKRPLLDVLLHAPFLMYLYTPPSSPTAINGAIAARDQSRLLPFHVRRPARRARSRTEKGEAVVVGAASVAGALITG